MAEPDPQTPDNEQPEQAPDGLGLALIFGGDAEVIAGEPCEENEETR